tara:strand:+ start:62 stop:496 length:435 start_codon:yes stop_codon:yes gene_type:complete
MFDIKSYEELMEFGEEEKWQVFEKLVGFIFEEHGFSVIQNKVVVFKDKRKRQYDVIASGFDKVYLVECKKWRNGRYKTSALKKSAVDHYKRCWMYKEVTSKKVVPVMVTLHDEDILFYEGVPLVSVAKLNNFLSKIEEYGLKSI